jgi:hypothetical protein
MRAAEYSDLEHSFRQEPRIAYRLQLVFANIATYDI